MLLSSSAVVATLLAGVAFAAMPTTNLTYSQVAIGGADTPLGGIATLNAWCTGQRSTCGTLCAPNGGTASNNCTAQTLAYSCTCNNNMSAPDSLPYYAVSIPAFTCQALFAACITANDNDQAGQEGCTNDYICGTNAIANFSQAPSSSSSSVASSMASTASPSTTTASSGSGTNPGSGTATTTSATTSPTHNAAQQLATYGNGVGLAALAAGVFGGFAFVL